MRAPGALAFRAVRLTPRTLGLNQIPVTLSCLVLPPSPLKADMRRDSYVQRGTEETSPYRGCSCSRSRVPSLWDLMTDLLWSCHNNIEIKCIIHVMCLNHPQVIPPLGPWKNCLPYNQSWFLKVWGLLI